MRGRRDLSTKTDLFKNIEHKRSDRGMSLEEFSRQLGIDRKTYHNLENKGDMPASMIITVSKILNCTTDYLLLTKND